MISLQDVHKRYRTAHGEVAALGGVTLEIDRGEFVAVRGHSGSGKSTLLSLIGGLALPTSGKVIIADAVISRMNSAERARFRSREVGFVFQLFHLLPYLNVLDNVLVAAPSSTARSELRQTASELLDKFGLAERRHHRPAQLSAGERQRVAVARALLNDPQLLIADEPTGNLDQENAAAMLDLLGGLNREGVTIVLATHDEEAAARAGRQVGLKKGLLDAEVGAHASR